MAKGTHCTCLWNSCLCLMGQEATITLFQGSWGQWVWREGPACRELGPAGACGGPGSAPKGTLCYHYLTDAWGMSSEAASVLQQPHGVLGEANESIHVGWGPRTCILYSLTQ